MTLIINLSFCGFQIYKYSRSPTKKKTPTTPIIETFAASFPLSPPNPRHGEPLPNPSPERGRETLGRQARLRDPLRIKRGHEVPQRPISLQPRVRVRVLDPVAALPHGLHLRHRPSHGARIRRSLQEVAFL